MRAVVNMVEEYQEEEGTYTGSVVVLADGKEERVRKDGRRFKVRCIR